MGRVPGGDALIAVVLAAVEAGAALTTSAAPLPSRLGGAVAAAGLLILAERRRRPVLVLVVTFLVTYAVEIATPHAFSVASFLAIMVAGYSVGAHASKRSLVLGLVLGVPAVAVGHALGNPAHYSAASADAFFFLILVLAPVSAGRVVRARSALAVRLRDATEQLTATRAERVASTLAADRGRLRRRIDADLTAGLGRIVEVGACVTLEDVCALEQIARDMLGGLRTLLGDLRAEEIVPEPRSAKPPTDRLTRAPQAAQAEDGWPAAQGTAGRLAGHRWATPSPRFVDAVLASVALATAGSLVAGVLKDAILRGPLWATALSALAVAAPIAAARRATLPAAMVTAMATVAFAALAVPSDPGSGVLPIGVLVVFPLALGAACRALPATIGLALCLAATALTYVVDPLANTDATTIAPGVALVLGLWAAGRVLRDRDRLLSALADTAAAIEEEHRQLARAAVEAERAKAAFELHDSVAHAMTVIALQAAAARRVWSSDPGLASQHAVTLRQTTADLVRELRETLVLLGTDDDTGAAAFGELVDRANASGVHVSIETTGDHAALEPALRHAAYRVLQEALTNAARHAPGADVAVRLDVDDAGLALAVCNPVPAASRLATPAAAGAGSGRGLIGMRERVEGCGGRLLAGPVAPGGFAVQAWLPRR